jgi:hypothetical protein
MPVSHRIWYIRRLIKDNEKQETINSNSNKNNIGNNMEALSKYEKMLDKAK